eukprot:IDg1510t1
MSVRELESRKEESAMTGDQLKKAFIQGLYDDNEETVANVDIVKRVSSRGRQSGTTAPATSTLITTESSRKGSGDGANAIKIAHYIAMRFRENSAKFSGDIGEFGLNTFLNTC